MRTLELQGVRAGRVRTDTPPIRERLRARVRAAQLDRELAGGAPADASPALALRAHVLAEPSVRRQLGRQLRRIVREAHQEARPSRRVAVRRRSVIEAEHELRLLASRLDSPLPVAVRGVARARVLLSDGCGPLYHRGSTDDLPAVVRQTIAALG